MSTPAVTGPQLFVTESAAVKLYHLLMQESLAQEDATKQVGHNPHIKLRISIDGGGCSGFKYDFLFEKAAMEDDHVFKKIVQIEGQQHEIEVLVNPISFMYLHNAEIDYHESFQDSEFKIRNPNAQTTCGCGSSFSA